MRPKLSTVFTENHDGIPGFKKVGVYKNNQRRNFAIAHNVLVYIKNCDDSGTKETIKNNTEAWKFPYECLAFVGSNSIALNDKH